MLNLIDSIHNMYEGIKDVLEQKISYQLYKLNKAPKA